VVIQKPENGSQDQAKNRKPDHGFLSDGEASGFATCHKGAPVNNE
jgi:hypothetical protein